MNDRSDELLSSYLDGELAAGEAKELERRLATDTALQARLDALRGADKATRELYAAVDAAPMPESVLALLAESAPQADNVVAFPERRLRQFWQMPVAIAASVAMVVGFVVSDFVEKQPELGTSFATLNTRSINEDSDLFELFEAQASGQVAQLDGDVSGHAVLSFVDEGGRFCRQVRLDAEAVSAYAVACREDGGWALETLAYGEAVAAGQYQQASAGTPNSINSAVDSLIGAADPLDSEQENLAISSGWKKVE